MENKELVELVKAKMKKLKISQYRLSEDSGVSQSSISSWFNGTRTNITVITFLKIANILGIKIK